MTTTPSLSELISDPTEPTPDPQWAEAFAERESEPVCVCGRPWSPDQRPSAFRVVGGCWACGRGPMRTLADELAALPFVESVEVVA